jgi:serine phosphatase RsbU (regulator of sigma subunit)
MVAISLMPDSKPQIDAEYERLDLLFRQSRSTSVVALVAAGVCAAIIHNSLPGPAPWVWFGAILLITAGRLLLYRRYFQHQRGRIPVTSWLRWHAYTAAPLGIAAGSLPLIPDMNLAPQYVQELEGLVPALVVMAAVTSFGVYISQYLVLLVSATLTTVATRLWMEGSDGIAMALMFAMFAPILAVTAKRYAESIQQSLGAKARSERLVDELTITNNELEHQNAMLAQQQDLIQQEEELAQHVFSQLTLGGDHELPGVYTWNQSMGSLSGDLTQTARGPGGQVYVFLGDFTGHGLPAALGALPASSVFLAMAAKGLPVETIAAELNRKLHELLPVGYFCCAVLLELTPDRRQLHVWNGGLPPLLIKRDTQADYEKLHSHSVPLGVLGEREFSTGAQSVALNDGDVVYAYTDGLTEAENLNGEMWGAQRLESFLLREDLPASKLPALIDAVLEHVNLAPASDDISIVELVASTDAKAVAA